MRQLMGITGDSFRGETHEVLRRRGTGGPPVNAVIRATHRNRQTRVSRAASAREPHEFIEAAKELTKEVQQVEDLQVTESLPPVRLSPAHGARPSSAPQNPSPPEGAVRRT